MGEIKGVEPDQRRNHEGYQHDRFPANADAVATSRREFSWGTTTCRGVPLGINYTASGREVKLTS